MWQPPGGRIFIERVTMSAIGTKRTSQIAPHMSAFEGRANMTFALHMSAFDPKRTSGDPGRWFLTPEC